MRASRSGGQPTRAGLIVLAVLAIGVPVAAQAVASAKPDYRGRIGGYAVSSVKFQFQGGDSSPQKVSFRATKVVLACETELSRADLGPISLRFDSPNSFEGASYSAAADGTERYFKVRGELLPDGRAKGYIYYFEDHPETTPYEADCSTAGARYGWRARRVR